MHLKTVTKKFKKKKKTRGRKSVDLGLKTYASSFMTKVQNPRYYKSTLEIGSH